MRLITLIGMGVCWTKVQVPYDLLASLRLLSGAVTEQQTTVCRATYARFGP